MVYTGSLCKSISQVLIEQLAFSGPQVGMKMKQVPFLVEFPGSYERQKRKQIMITKKTICIE